MMYKAVFEAYGSVAPYPFHVQGDSIKNLLDNIEMYLTEIYPMRKIVDGKLIKCRNSEAKLLAAYEDNNEITTTIKDLLKQ